MPLETANFIAQLVATNPPQTDLKRQGDDQLRLIKGAVQGSFPDSNKAFYMPKAEAKAASFAVVLADMNKTFYVDTTGGLWVATLPTLTAADAGWECHFIKTNSGTNPMFLAPPSGSIQSGEYLVSRARRCIPGARSTVLWTGVGWFVNRVPGGPVGSCLEFDGASLPVGYEWPNGQTLASASSNYPEYNAVIGSGLTQDKRGRVTAAKDDMGGTSANRLTSPINGDALGAAGGAESHVLTAGQMPIHNHTAEQDTHDHGTPNGFSFMTTPGGSSGGWNTAGAGPVLPTNQLRTGGADPAITVGNAGNNEAHPNVQPTIIANKILIVE